MKTQNKASCEYCGSVKGYKSLTTYHGKKFCKDNDCLKKWRYESKFKQYGKIMIELREKY